MLCPARSAEFGILAGAGYVIGDRLARFVIVAIVLVWVMTTVVLPLVVKGYSPPTEIGTVMGIVAGGAVAVIFAKRGSKNGNGRPGKKNGRSLHERALERGKQQRGKDVNDA